MIRLAEDGMVDADQGSHFGPWQQPDQMPATEPSAKRQPRLLTVRERQVLVGLAYGYTNREIGASLGISARTVEIHRASLLRKFHARSSAHAVLLACQAGEFMVMMEQDNA